MKISVIIPAHNEGKYIGKCIDAIHRAAKYCPADIEIVVVANRCTDNTEQIAKAMGAKVITDEDRNLSIIRNDGVRASSGEIIVTIDADSLMSENALAEVLIALTSGRYMGGGVKFIPERYSPGINASYAILRLIHFINGFSGGMFWLYRTDFDAMGGFDESLIIGEDHDLAMRLKRLARKNHMKFGNLPGAYIVTSCRKFDTMGDWHVFKLFFKDFIKLMQCISKKNTEFADKYYFDYPY